MRKRGILLPLLLAGLLMALASGAALGKAHVPAGQVQVSHKGRTAINVAAPALQAHIDHGDFQLPACDFNNVFGKGSDTSGIADTNGSGQFDEGDLGFNAPRDSAEGIKAACPVGTF